VRRGFYRQDAEVAKRIFYKEKKKSCVAKCRGGAKKRIFRNGKMGIFFRVSDPLSLYLKKDIGREDRE